MHSPIVATPLSEPLLTPYTSEIMTPVPLVQPATSSCCKKSIESESATLVPEEVPSVDAFDFTSYDIGDAVASGWNSLEEFAFDPTFGVQIPAFTNEQSWDSSIDPLPDIGATSIPDTADIKPEFASPTGLSAAPRLLTAHDVHGNLVPAAPSSCSHQFCCQHGTAHPNPQVLPEGLQPGFGIPFHSAPLPMI